MSELLRFAKRDGRSKPSLHSVVLTQHVAAALGARKEQVTRLNERHPQPELSLRVCNHLPREYRLRGIQWMRELVAQTANGEC